MPDPNEDSPDSVRDLFGDSPDSVRDLFGDSPDSVRDLFGDSPDSVRDLFGDSPDSVRDLFGDSPDSVRDLFEPFDDLDPERATHADDGAGRPRPVLVWRAAAPFRCASSGALGGGVGDRSWVFNAEVSLDYGRADADAHLAEIAGELRLAPGKGTGLMTAAPVLAVEIARDDGVGCAATVGVSTPTWAAAPDGTWSRWAPGTINLVITVPARLSDAALVNAVVTATEAKTQALMDAGVPGTGTASDAVVICCPPGGGEPYGGPRSTWGARLARAVHASVEAGTKRFLTRPH